ncbi:MAG TPA: helix-turn-helix domain-containing protein [Bacteroidia bacterium]|nr:helix-turn-helix domain-containing protein [Bacteroidia bacterium]
MRNQHFPGKFLFGDWNGAVLWAVDSRTEEGEVRDETLLPRGQVVFAIPATKPLHLRTDSGSEIVEPGSVLVVDTKNARAGLDLTGGSDAILIGMRFDAMSGLLEPFRPGLDSRIRDLVYGAATQVEIPGRSEVFSQIVPSVRTPIVAGAARAFWYESQLKAFLALQCFVQANDAGEFFCSRQKRLARVRVMKAKTRIEARLDEVLDLNRLASEVGCSASYLSRTFSATTGMTISQYLRKRRIETAAELLVSGDYNVSEVAAEVGYQSLSHFSKAFQQVKGVLPSKYEAA